MKLTSLTKNYLKKFSVMFFMLLAIMATGTLQNGNVANAAELGQELSQPEDGWKRYDDTDSNISYKNIISANDSSLVRDANYYNSTIHYWNSGECYFNFTGDKIRIIAYVYGAPDNADWWNLCNQNIQISIDGKSQSFSEKYKTPINKANYMYLVFEATGLNKGEHFVKLQSEGQNTGSPLVWTNIDAIDLDMNGELLPYSENAINQSISLDKAMINLNVGTLEQLSAKINPQGLEIIEWSSSDTSIATVDLTGKVVGLKEGKAIITAKIQGTEKNATCQVNVTTNIIVPDQPVTTSSAVILNIEPEKSQIKLKETVFANLTIDNIKEIAAEDARIKYDSSKLKFLGMTYVDGIKLVKDEEKEGELRVIVASKGTANIASSKKTLLKLNFQGIAAGDALVDISKGRVSDGITMEKDLTDQECGQAIIKIEDAILDDVNHSGGFTLLDLAIDGRHFGEDPASLSEYNTDQAINGAIDDDDLLKIGEYMLGNPNYSANK
jgi:uncharacterized protein YjdB